MFATVTLAVSHSKCNVCIEYLIRCLVVQGFTGACIQGLHYLGDLRLGEVPQGHALGEIFSYEAIGFLSQCSLPRLVWSRKIEVCIELIGHVDVARKLRTVV